ncbi:hypothetical protein L1049_018966 [Liquidambar formosana]|uniref:Uncharacterized protein n=1 Tax=Liquidambar formosana TaxID=63359 RepID=A0AAP0RAU4_LIQFO
MSAPEIECEINETRIVPPTGSESDLPLPGPERHKHTCTCTCARAHPQERRAPERIETSEISIVTSAVEMQRFESDLSDLPPPGHER